MYLHVSKNNFLNMCTKKTRTSTNLLSIMHNGDLNRSCKNNLDRLSDKEPSSGHSPPVVA